MIKDAGPIGLTFEVPYLYQRNGGLNREGCLVNSLNK